MYSSEYANKPSLKGLVITAVVIVVLAAYGVISINTGDLLWFYPKFTEKPTAMTVHCYGENVAVDPYGEYFNELNSLVNDTLSGSKRWDPLSMSEITYEEYQTHPKMMTLEVSYPSSVRIHTDTIYFSNVDTLIFPLDGRHAEKQTIFGRTLEGNNAAGSLHVESTSPLREFLDNKSICEMPEAATASQ
jgi:hypothetical protein